MMMEQDREVRINRAIYWLREGVPPDQLDPVRIDVAASELPELVEIAKQRMIEIDDAYAASTRKGALGYMAFGALMLFGCLYLAHGDVPALRQGRLLLALGVGGASLVWGLFRFFNHNPGYDF